MEELYKLSIWTDPRKEPENYVISGQGFFRFRGDNLERLTTPCYSWNSFVNRGRVEFVVLDSQERERILRLL